MPGGDRTGPLGQGPMSGGGFGNCGGNSAPGYRRFGGAGFGFGGRGMGFGPGFGRGRGMHLRRRRFWGNDPDVVAPAYPQGPDYPEAGEAELLRREAQYMEASLEQIKKRLSQLEKQAQTDKTDKEKE